MTEQSKSRFAFLAHPFVNTLVTSVFTLLIAWATGWIQSHEAVLQWVAPESSPFERKPENTSIYSVFIYNVGNKEADGVNWTIRVPGARFEEPKFTKPDSIEVKTRIEGDLIRLHVEKLNPNTSIGTQVMAFAAGSLPSKPKVDLSATGINGNESNIGTQSASQSGLPVWFNLLWVPLIALWTYLLMSSRKYRYRIKVERVNPECLRVLIVEGKGASDDWITVPKYGYLEKPRIYYAELELIGEGEHIVLK